MTKVDVPSALLVLGGSAVGAYVGSKIGGAKGVLIGSLTGAFVGALSAGMITRVKVRHRKNGDIEIEFETTSALMN